MSAQPATSPRAARVAAVLAGAALAVPAGLAAASPAAARDTFVTTRYADAAVHTVLRSPGGWAGTDWADTDTVVIDLTVTKRYPAGTVTGSARGYACPADPAAGDPAKDPACTPTGVRYVDQVAAPTVPTPSSMRVVTTLTLTSGPYGLGGAVGTLPVDLTWTGSGPDLFTGTQHIHTEGTLERQEILRPRQVARATVTGTVEGRPLPSSVGTLQLTRAVLSTRTVGAQPPRTLPAPGPQPGGRQVAGLTGTVHWVRNVVASTSVPTLAPITVTEVGDLAVTDEGSAGVRVTGRISQQRCGKGQLPYVEGTAPTSASCTVVVRAHVADGATAKVTSDQDAGDQRAAGRVALVSDGVDGIFAAPEALTFSLRWDGGRAIGVHDLLAGGAVYELTDGNRWPNAVVVGTVNGTGLRNGSGTAGGDVLGYLRFPA